MKSISTIFITILMTTQVQAKMLYKIGSSLKANEQAAFVELFHKAEALLPKKISTTINRTISVRVENLKNDKTEALAKIDADAIVLDTSVINEVVRGEANATPTNRAHKTFYREILATLLHETTHLYDFMNVHTDEEYRMLRKCHPVETRDKAPAPQLPEECAPYLYMNKTFSQNPYFKLITGFIKEDQSWFQYRSPDIYETENTTEAFAVNMEFFLMDPEFSCRRPTMAKLFKSFFQHDPFPGSACSNKLTYIVPDFQGKSSSLKVIDPARVYQIEYLLASKGEAIMSGFGHSMFRVVICAPNRKVVGPDCLKDLQYHVVLSYRAFIDSMNTSIYKGLVGDYPSRLFFVSMDQVIDEYNRIEMRDLYGIPLKLTPRERLDFLTRAIETHWSYDGKYYFIKNNCATESMNLLKSSVWKPGLIYKSIKSPMSLEALLKKENLSIPVNFDDRMKAIQDGHLLDSYRERYELAYTVMQQNLPVTDENFEEFLKQPAIQRGRYYKHISALQGKERVKAAASVVILEMAAHRFLKAEVKANLQNAAIEEMKAAEKSGRKSDSARIAAVMTDLSDMFSRPSSFITGAAGYGLPSDADLLTVAKKAAAKVQIGADIYTELEKKVQGIITKQQLQELKDIKANTDFALTFMKSL
jgi:hypothetical protein